MIDRNKLRCKECGYLDTYYAKKKGVRVCTRCGHQEKEKAGWISG